MQRPSPLGAACGAQQLNQRAQQLNQKKALSEEEPRMGFELNSLEPVGESFMPWHLFAFLLMI
jgi:hypothetical protein